MKLAVWWNVHQHHRASPMPGFVKSFSRSAHVFEESSFVVRFRVFGIIWPRVPEVYVLAELCYLYQVAGGIVEACDR